MFGRDGVVQGGWVCQTFPWLCGAGVRSILGKFNILVGIPGWKDDETKLKYLPLFLEGDAFLVFSSLSDADKKSLAKVRGKLEGLSAC